MSTASAILGIVPGLQVTAMVGQNLKFVKQSMKPTKKLSPKKIVKIAAFNLIGISLLKPTAQAINTLD